MTYFGTGTIIDSKGLVLTSYTVVPEKARDIRIYLRGGRVGRARIVETQEKDEVSLVRIENLERLVPSGRGAGEDGADKDKAKDKATLPWLELGASERVRVGDRAYTFGNAFNAIENDDQVVMAAGLVSGRLELDVAHHPEATYLGEVIETTAALNNGMDGGPLVDREGRVVGLLSLSFSRHRWLGTAIPIDVLLDTIGPHLSRYSDIDGARGKYLGLIARDLTTRDDEESGVLVTKVDEKGPAHAAGLRLGDRLLELGSVRLEKAGDLRRVLAEAAPGARLEARVRRGDEQLKIEISLWGKF